jgi:predicted phage baseplate assembly protein
VGNGSAGNVGAETITRVVRLSGDSAVSGGAVTRVRNPLAAAGGTDPEPVAEAKLRAPLTFRERQLRAITADDYARRAEDLPGVQRAAAALRWTGSGYEAQVAVDPAAEGGPRQLLLEAVGARLGRYRRIGHGLAVRAPAYVPLDVALCVIVEPTFQTAHVRAALLERLGVAEVPGGGLGFFHLDRFTFGTPVRLSEIVAAAQAVEGVREVTVTRLQRYSEPSRGERERGVLAVSPLEVVRLDNDPLHPERGVLTLDLRGGR